MTFTLRPLDPESDAPLVHAWVSKDRARFWGMTDKAVEEVRDVYAFVDSLDTHHAHLVHHDGAPVALLQTYEPLHDPVGEVYAARPDDLGVHLLVAAGDPRPGFTASLVGFLLASIRTMHPAARRLVVEPDVDNEKSVARVLRSGFEPGPVVDLGHKTAQLAFLPLEPGEGQGRTVAPVVAS